MLNSEENFDNFGEDQEGGMFGMFSKKSAEPSMPSPKQLPSAKLAAQKKWEENKNYAKKALTAPVTGSAKLLGEGAKALKSTPQAFGKMTTAIHDFASTPLSPAQQIDLTKDLSQREYSDGIKSFNSKYNEFIKKIINNSDLNESKVKVEKKRILQLLCEIRSFDIKNETTKMFNKLAIHIETVLNSRGETFILGEISNFMPNSIAITNLIIDTINNNNDAIEKDAIIKTNLKEFFLQLLIIYFYPSTILYIICENMIEYIDIIKKNRDKFIDESTDSQDIKNTLDSLLDIFNQNKDARIARIVEQQHDRGRNRAGIARQQNRMATVDAAAATTRGQLDAADAAVMEAERAEAERVEAERVEAERVEAERAEAERAEPNEAEVARAAAERAEAAVRARVVARAAARGQRYPEYKQNYNGGAPLDHSNIDLTMIKNYNNLLEGTNPYLHTSARMFYKALTNFAVSITIYDKNKDEVKQTIVEYLQTIFMDKFAIIFDDNFTKSDKLQEAELQFALMKTTLQSSQNGTNFLRELIELETLQGQLKTATDDDNVVEKKKVEKKIEEKNDLIETFKVSPSVGDDIARYIAAKKILDFRSQPLETIKKNNTILRYMFAPNSEKDNPNSDAYINDYYKFITEIFTGERGNSSNYIITIDKSIVKGIGMSSMFAFSSSPDAPVRVAAGRARVAVTATPGAPATAAADAAAAGAPTDPFYAALDQINAGVPPEDVSWLGGGTSGGKRRTRRYKKRAGTRRQKKRRGTHRKRKNTTK
jgi:hypothetical protein